jgi:hypothetical protein
MTPHRPHSNLFGYAKTKTSHSCAALGPTAWFVINQLDEQSKLREKREVLLRSLVDGLPQDFPKFTPFVQGSNAMQTGEVPLDGNYDIDVGLIFDCSQKEFPDPDSEAPCSGCPNWVWANR